MGMVVKTKKDWVFFVVVIIAVALLGKCASAADWKHENYYSEKICIEEFNGLPSFLLKTHDQTKSSQYAHHYVDCETTSKSIEFDWLEKSNKPDECIGQANRYATITGKQATCVLLVKVGTFNQDRYKLYERTGKRGNVIMYYREVQP